MTPAPTLLAGAGLRLLAVFLITAMSALIHALGDSLQLGQVIFWRGAVAVLPILGWMALRRELPGGLRSRHPGLHLTRGLFGAFSMALSFVSLIYLPVANAQALAYLAPVLTLPLAARLLGERLTPAAVLAVALGFGGVIAMLWQTLETPGRAGLIGIGAGLGYALTMAFVRVHIKAMTASESTGAIAFWFAAITALCGLATLPFGWAPLLPAQVWMLAAAGLLGGLAHIAATEAVARAPVSAVAPFDFTGLVWAVGFDALLFRHLPGPLGWAGMAAIAAAMVLAVLPGRSRR